jgi:putative hydrolase of the HAD superfamily
LVKAVAFDYGGVISWSMEEKDMEDIAALAGVGADLMKRIYWDNRIITDQGLVGAEEYFRNILADVGVFPDPHTISLLVNRDIESWSRINPATEKLMKDLKGAGFRIGILSNMIKAFLDKNRETMPVFKIPEAMIFSCDVNAVKPEEKIYRILLDRLGCEAGEMIFFDDVEINVEAARKLGIEAFVWKDADLAREQLKVLGIHCE